MTELDLIERRVADMEQLVFGNDGPPTWKMSESKTILEMLDTTRTRLANSEKRPVIAAILARATEINKYMDLHFMEEDAMSTESKVKVIVSEQDKIEQTATALEAIHKMSHVLNHASFTEISRLRDQLNKLRPVLHRQQEQSAELISASQSLLDNYHTMIYRLSLLFTDWNQRVLAKKS